MPKYTNEFETRKGDRISNREKDNSHIEKNTKDFAHYEEQVQW